MRGFRGQHKPVSICKLKKLHSRTCLLLLLVKGSQDRPLTFVAVQCKRLDVANYIKAACTEITAGGERSG